MIIVKYLDGDQKEHYGKLKRQMWQGVHKGKYELELFGSKRKVYVSEKNVVDVRLATQEEEVALGKNDKVF